MRIKYWMLLVACPMLHGCSSTPPSCGDTQTIEAVQFLLKQAIEKAGENTVREKEFDQAWPAIRLQVQIPTTTGHDKAIEKVSCEATVNVRTTFPPEVLWSYPYVHEALHRRFPKKQPGDTTTAAPSELRSSSIRYSSQLTDDRKTHIVKIEGHERLSMLVAALVEGHAFAPRLIVLEEKPPDNITEAREFVEYAAQKIGRNTHPHDFVKDPVINARFKTLLGKQLETFEYNLSVSSGVRLDGDYIVGDGNAPHMGSIEYAAFTISTWTGALTAVLHTDDKFQQFGVKTVADLPWPLYNWLRKSTAIGTPLPALMLDSALCSTLRKIAIDNNLRDQADLLKASKIVVCTSKTNCTRFDSDRSPSPTEVFVENVEGEVRDALPDAEAYLVDINNDYVNDILVQSIGGTLSCVTSIPLMGKLLHGAKPKTMTSYSFSFDKRFKDLKLNECGIYPEYLRFRNYVFSAIMGTLGPEPFVKIGVGTPSGFQSCDK